MITYIYMIVIIGALIFQVMIGVRVYQKAANSAQYLSSLWPTSSIAYRTNLQNQVNTLDIHIFKATFSPLISSLNAVDSKQQWIALC